MDLFVDVSLGFGIGESGVSWDSRPGADPKKWTQTDTYTWPVPDGPDTDHPAPTTLLPAPLDPAWETNTSGIYARSHLSHFNQLGTVPWEQYERLGNGDWVLMPKGAGEAVLQSIDQTDENCAIGFNLHAYGRPISSGDTAVDGSGRVISVQFGSHLAAERFTLNIYENGRAYLSKGGDFTNYGGYGVSAVVPLKDGWIVPNQWGTIVGHWLKIFIVPHGRNKILVTSSTGAGFVWKDDGITQADPPQTLHVVPFPRPVKTITSRAPVVHAADPKVNLQPFNILNYKPSGSMTPAQPVLYQAPYTFAGGESVIQSTIHGDNYPPLVGYSSIAATFTVSVPVSPENPEKRNVVPTVTFTQKPGMPHHTPMLYRHEIKIPPVPKPNPSKGFLLTDVIELRHEETKDGFTGTVRIRNAESHASLITATNLPAYIGDATHEFCKFSLVQPKWEPRGVQRFLSWSLQGLMRRLETTLLGSLTRLDGFTVSDAVKQVLAASGFPEDGSLWDVDELPAAVLSNGQIDQRALNLSDVTRSAADWLRYLRDEYTSSSEVPFQWVMGFKTYAVKGGNVVKFYFKDPAKLSANPSRYYYPTHDSAVANGHTPREIAYRSVHRNLTETYIEPEANWVEVVGLTMDDQPLYCLKTDPKSIDPTIPLAQRLKNWLGEPRQIVDVNCGFVTQKDVNAACAKEFKRLSAAQYQANFEAEWDPQLSMWDKVRIYRSELHLDDYADYRIAGIAVNHLYDGDETEASPRRIAQYTGLRLV